MVSDDVIRRESLSGPNHPAMRSWLAKKQSTSLSLNIASEPKPQIANSVRCQRTRLRVPAYGKERVSAVADGPLPFASLEIGKLN